MNWEIKILEEPASEPVDLATIKDFLRIDADYTHDDNLLLLICAASREKLEGHTGLYLAPKVVELQFTGNVQKLPYGPTVEIYYLERVDGNDPYADTDYFTRGLNFKTLYAGINEGSVVWWYPINNGLPEIFEGGFYGNCVPTYNCYYKTGYAILPKLLKDALLSQIDYSFKNQGITDMDSLSPIAEQLADRFSKNLVIS